MKMQCVSHQPARPGPNDEPPADAVFQCNCEVCKDPLFDTDDRESYALCSHCEEQQDEADARRRREIFESDLQDFNWWRAS